MNDPVKVLVKRDELILEGINSSSWQWSGGVEVHTVTFCNTRKEGGTGSQLRCARQLFTRVQCMICPRKSETLYIGRIRPGGSSRVLITDVSIASTQQVRVAGDQP
jgi:hypothetical protein